MIQTERKEQVPLGVLIGHDIEVAGVLTDVTKAKIDSVIDEEHSAHRAWLQDRRFQRYFGPTTPEQLDQTPREAFRAAFTEAQRASTEARVSADKAASIKNIWESLTRTVSRNYPDGEGPDVSVHSGDTIDSPRVGHVDMAGSGEPRLYPGLNTGDILHEMTFGSEIGMGYLARRITEILGPLILGGSLQNSRRMDDNGIINDSDEDALRFHKKSQSAKFNDNRLNRCGDPFNDIRKTDISLLKLGINTSPDNFGGRRLT